MHVAPLSFSRIQGVPLFKTKIKPQALGIESLVVIKNRDFGNNNTTAKPLKRKELSSPRWINSKDQEIATLINSLRIKFK